MNRYLRLNDIDVTGFTAPFTVSVEVAAIRNVPGSPNFPQPDTFAINEPLSVQYAWGTDSGGTGSVAALQTGNYTNVGQFAGTGVSDEAPREDTTMPFVANMGTGNGTVLSNELQTFTYTIPAGVGDLSIQMRAYSLDGSDEYVFDNIRVNGAVVPEPSAFLLLGLVACGSIFFRRMQILSFFFKR